MAIADVLRGDGGLASSASTNLLYQATGWEARECAQLPLILKRTGTGKLRTRDADKLAFPVFPLAYKDEKTEDMSRGYREDGYFSEAVINFLAFLGWNPGTEQENFSLDELVQAFDLSRVNKSGARFDPDKIKWFNHHYMQEQDNDELAEQFKILFPEELNDIDVQYISMVINLIKERATFVTDFWDLGHFFFVTPSNLDEKATKKAWKEDSPEIMKELITVITSIDDYTVENLQTVIKGWITSKEIGFGKVMMPLRLALVGALQGPEVFDIMYLIGKDESVRRIENLINTLS